MRQGMEIHSIVVKPRWLAEPRLNLAEVGEQPQSTNHPITMFLHNRSFQQFRPIPAKAEESHESHQRQHAEETAR
ncbi:MAG: hypothetical protein BGO63_03665 [Candidatus Accumulibacter sp. 66-26]|nr:MAG: hypothetical protein BGO63_03665 [Candidatus Accumulibacter sp. 66-26]